MTTEPSFTLNAERLQKFIDEDDDIYMAELNYDSPETPWGKIESVPGASYSHGDGHPTGFVVTVGGKYFLINGIYSSWDSTRYDNLIEVEPVEVTVTRFKTLKGTVLEDPTLGDKL